MTFREMMYMMKYSSVIGYKTRVFARALYAIRVWASACSRAWTPITAPYL